MRRDAGTVEKALLIDARGRQEPEPGAGGPARDERQHRAAGLVQPRQVVDHDQDRSGGARLREELQCRVGKRQPIRHRAAANPEGAVKCRAPLFSQPAQIAVQQGEQQLVQSGKAHVRLELGTSRAEQPQPARGGIRRGRLDQSGLPDAGLPGHHERAAVMRGMVDECPDDRDVAVTSYQLRAGAELVVLGPAHPKT